MYFLLVSSLNKLRECRSVLLLLIECGVAIINTCSPINIYICLHFQDFSFHFLHLLLARLARRVSFAFRISLGNLPKIQTGIYRDLFSLCEENIVFFYICFFLFAFIVPLFYTEKGNCFSLTRFTTFYFFSLSDSNLPVYLSSVCNLVSFESVFIIHIIHNPGGAEKRGLSTNDDVLSHYIKVVILTILLLLSDNQNF